MKETDAEIFEKALEFLYTGTYDDGPLVIPENTTQRIHNIFAQEAGSSTQETVRENEDAVCDSPGVGQDLEDHVYTARTFDGSALLLNVQLYNLGEFLQVQQLKEESLKRCTELMEKRFDAANFVDGMKEALTHVNEQDLELNAQIFRSCIENWQEVEECPALDDLLMDYQPIAWTVSKEKVADLERVNNEQSLNVSRLKKKIDLLQEEVSIVKDELDQAYKLVRNHSHCRNCGQEFGGYLENVGSGKTMLRCDKCRCRHESLSR